VTKSKNGRMIEMGTTTILFDLGDTLHDLTYYTSFARRISIEKLIDQGVPITNTRKAERLFEDVVSRHCEPHSDKLFLDDSYFKNLFEELDVKVGSTVPRIALIIYRDIIRSLITPSPMVIQTLSTLKGRGYRLGLVTDGRVDTTYEILQRLGINEFFDAIVVSEEVGVEKPNPRIFKEAMFRLHANPSEIMIVGDNLERDILGGKESGMITVLMKRHRLNRAGNRKIKPDFKIQLLSELLNLLARSGGSISDKF